MISSLSSSTSSLASTLFSKLDTRNQGYIEKSDLQSAFAALSETGDSDTSDVDAVFKQLDADGDEKVTKSEMTAAIERLSEQLNTQFDQSRVRGGGGHGHGRHMPPPAVEASQNSTDTQYDAAADANGDGTVSAEEEAAFAAGSSEAATAEPSAETGLQALLGALGAGMPPPVRKDDNGAFTLDELTEQLSEIGSTDSKRSELLATLVANFDTADSDGDGKIARDEARAFGKEQGVERAGRAENEGGAGQARIVQLLRAYGVGEGESSLATQSISLTA